jgi:hypothetical protein
MKRFLLACLVAVLFCASIAPASAQYLQGGEVTAAQPITTPSGVTVAFEFVLNLGDYYPLAQGYADFPGQLNWGEGVFHAQLSNSGVCGAGSPVNPSCEFVGVYNPATITTRRIDADCQEISFPVTGALAVTGQPPYAASLAAVYSQQFCVEAGVAFMGGGGLTIHLK